MMNYEGKNRIMTNKNSNYVLIENRRLTVG